jgi:hypothetical protein
MRAAGWTLLGLAASVGLWYVKGTSGSGNANLTISQAGTVSGTTAPYVQLLACKYVGN